MDFKTLHKQRKMMLIAAVIGIIAVFLPWITVSAGFLGESMTKNTNGFHGMGILAFIAFAAAGIVAISGKQAEPLDKTTWIIGLIIGAVALLSVGIFMLNSSDSLGSIGFASASYGFGCWIALAAGVAVTAAAWVLRAPGYTLQSGIDSLKGKMATPGTTTVQTDNSSSNTTAGANKADALERLINLRNEGKITEEEYKELKSKLL